LDQECSFGGGKKSRICNCRLFDNLESRGVLLTGHFLDHSLGTISNPIPLANVLESLRLVQVVDSRHTLSDSIHHRSFWDLLGFYKHTVGREVLNLLLQRLFELFELFDGLFIGFSSNVAWLCFFIRSFARLLSEPFLQHGILLLCRINRFVLLSLLFDRG